MTRCRRSCEQIAYCDRAKLRVHLAKNLAHQCHGLPVARGLSLIQHDAWVVVSRARDDARDALVIGVLTLRQNTFITQNHHRSRLHFICVKYVEVFGAVSIGQPDVPGNYYISFKEARQASGSVMARYARRRRLFAHAEDTVELFAFAYDTSIGPAVSEHALKCVALADPEHAGARLAYPDHPFELVAEALGASAIDRVSTHTREKLALAGHTEVGIAYPHDPAPSVRFAENTDIAAAATLDSDAIRVVDRNDRGVFGAVGGGVHSLSVLALGGDPYIVRALTENPMEILAGSYDPSRGFAIAMDAMSTVADAPNSEAATTRALTFDAGAAITRAFTIDAGHFTVRRCS